MYRLAATIVCFLLMSFWGNAGAAVTYKAGFTSANGTHTMPMLTISRQIMPEDTEVLLKSLKTLRQELERTGGMMIKNGVNFAPVFVDLNSLGGDVEAALAMGRILRDHEATVVVSPNGKCVSACVFLLAGGTSRLVYGRVGIHRPYLPDDRETTVQGQRLRYQRLGLAIREYLEAVNIPTELYDRMMRVAPENIHWLSEGELQTYGLSVNDPYSEEARTAREAEMWGLSKRDFLEARQEGYRVCNQPNTREHVECLSRVFRKARETLKK